MCCNIDKFGYIVRILQQHSLLTKVLNVYCKTLNNIDESVLQQHCVCIAVVQYECCRNSKPEDPHTARQLEFGMSASLSNSISL